MAVKFTEEDLMNLDNKTLITLFLQLQDSFEQLNKNLAIMTQDMAVMREEISYLRQSKFGRSSEKRTDESNSDYQQMILVFNEAEVTVDLAELIAEPELEEIHPSSYKRKKSKGKREADLRDLPVTVINHKLTPKELDDKLGKGWKELPEQVYKKLTFHPASFEVEEHHVGVYAGKDDTIIRAPHPKNLLDKSLVTPSLAAGIFNYKFVNSQPIARLESEFNRQDVNLSRQVMCNWVIKLSENWLSLLYDRLKTSIKGCKVIQADETPCLVNRDGRPAGSKSYMWVYRSGSLENSPSIVLYDYERTRNTEHPREFLSDYKGACITDGYQVYHTLDKERPDIHFAGCWAHARRKFDDVIKANGKNSPTTTVASKAITQIGAMYKLENSYAELTAEERQGKRQLGIKPIVDAFFVWLESIRDSVPSQSKTGKAITYCLNQETYLREFLNDGNIPIDNNAAERSIRSFCLGKKNWYVIDTIHGAEASAIAYSIAETAKENNLRPYEYFEHLFEVIPQHQEDTDVSFLDDLLPWSPNLPMKCRKSKDEIKK